MATSSVKLKGDDKTIAGYLKTLPKGQRDIAEALHALLDQVAVRHGVADGSHAEAHLAQDQRNAAGGLALARAALAHNAQSLASIQIEVNAVDRADDAAQRFAQRVQHFVAEHDAAKPRFRWLVQPGHSI